MLNKPKTLSTKKPLHRTIFTHVFSTQKTFDTEKHVHTDCTHIVLQTDFFAGKHFTQNNFYTTCFLRTDAFKNAQKKAQQFLQTDGLYTESSPHRSLTHRKFYAQHCTTFFCIQMLLRGCLYTDTNCTQKLVHTARIYTQPPFTQRGFASPSWSPTFRVPPLKWYFANYTTQLFEPLLYLLWQYWTLTWQM